MQEHFAADLRHGGNVWEEGRPEDWLDFSANLRPEGTPEWVMEVMRGALGDARYYPDRAMRAARRGLAAYAGVAEDCVLPTAGGASAIDLALSLDAGRVICHPPTFGEYAERARVRGREVVADGEVRPGDTLVRCNPNNPTGEALSRTAMGALLEETLSRGGRMLADEAFIDFCPDCSLRGDLRPGLVITGSLTKSLCIPGVRLGYVLADAETIRILADRALPWSLNMLAAAVCAALPGHLEELKQDRILNERRRGRMAGQLEALGAKVLPSRSNFLLVDFGREMTESANRLKRQGVLVRTCASFGLGPNWIRLAVKREEENDRLIRLLAEIG